MVFDFCRNLKKAEDKLVSLQDEIEENKGNVKNLEDTLLKLEDEATQVMEAYQESQVGTQKDPPPHSLPPSLRIH